ncbi:hypothetical protein EG328_000413 [Venturia inaequalis]|uniref:Secreted protein n=1 Tax=Venturia inaequalis TaxID=5025 RepID=A0A8H3V3X7_VENIN|nr:hypothetical protein EG328_000413 [Venturia inaequalis]KAE9980283.1 hypothetical protein EG327_006641 [Venturia inaequalis]RDI89950.1 hypothetical protein Vi05172_g747 [Venturia inaequalis]
MKFTTTLSLLCLTINSASAILWRCYFDGSPTGKCTEYYDNGGQIPNRKEYACTSVSLLPDSLPA